MATEIYRHWFYVESLILTVGDNYTLDPSVIGGVQFNYDYLQRRLPVIKIKLSMKNDLIKLLYDKQDAAKLAIEIVENTVDGNDNIINSKTFVKDTYDIVPLNSVDTYDTITTDDPNNEIDPKMDIITLYLIKNSRIQYMDKEISTVFANTDTAAAIQSLFTMREIPSKTCIITPPENNTEIDYMVLKLGSLVKNVDSLNSMYGIWSSPMIIFDDYQYIYCIDRNNPNIVLPKATDYDTVLLMVSNARDGMRVARGSGNSSENRTHYVNLASEPAVEDNSTTTTKTEFGTIAAINSDGTVKKVTVDENSPKMKFVRGRNDMTVDQYVNTHLRNPIVVTVTAELTALSIFKPYKTYRFDVDNASPTLSTLRGKDMRLRNIIMSLKRKQERLESNVVMQLSVVAD